MPPQAPSPGANAHSMRFASASLMVPALHRADRLERVDDRDVLLGAVGEAHPAGRDRAGVEEDRGEVEARGRHEHAGDRLVAAGEQHRAVEALGLHDDLDRVGDDLARDEREVHALVAHRDAVGDRDGAELQRVPAAAVHALLRGLREAGEREVARRDLVPRARDADLRLVPVRIAHADGAEHPAARHGLDAVGDGATTRFGIELRHAFESMSRAKRPRAPRHAHRRGARAARRRPRGCARGRSRSTCPGRPSRPRRRRRARRTRPRR